MTDFILFERILFLQIWYNAQADGMVTLFLHLHHIHMSDASFIA